MVNKMTYQTQKFKLIKGTKEEHIEVDVANSKAFFAFTRESIAIEDCVNYEHYLQRENFTFDISHDGGYVRNITNTFYDTIEPVITSYNALINKEVKNNSLLTLTDANSLLDLESILPLILSDDNFKLLGYEHMGDAWDKLSAKYNTSWDMFSSFAIVFMKELNEYNKPKPYSFIITNEQDYDDVTKKLREIIDDKDVEILNLRRDLIMSVNETKKAVEDLNDLAQYNGNIKDFVIRNRNIQLKKEVIKNEGSRKNIESFKYYLEDDFTQEKLYI